MGVEPSTKSSGSVRFARSYGSSLVSVADAFASVFCRQLWNTGYQQGRNQKFIWKCVFPSLSPLLPPPRSGPQKGFRERCGEGANEICSHLTRSLGSKYTKNAFAAPWYLSDYIQRVADSNRLRSSSSSHWWSDVHGCPLLAIVRFQWLEAASGTVCRPTLPQL